MIKIEITDPHLLDKKTLQETACYLMALTGGKLVIPSDLSIQENLESINASKSKTTLKPFKEEEFIPVSSEIVNISPVSAATVFNSKSLIDLDSDGLPWDMRIHARTKTKTTEGKWKKLRGVGPLTVKEIEEELKEVQNIPAPPVVIGSIDNVSTFTDLMSLVTGAITAGTLKRDQVIEILKPYGLPSLALVSTRLDLIPSIMFSIKEVINATC